MLDGTDRDTRVVTNHGAQRQVLDGADVRWNVGHDTIAAFDKKPKAGVALSGVQHHGNRRAAMYPCPTKLYFARQRRLARPDEAF